MGRREETSRRKPTADLGGSPSGLQEGDRITRSVLEFGRCATDSGEPLVCIVTSSLKNVASPRSVDAPTAPYGKSRAYNAGFHGLSPSGVCLQANWENSGNYDWGFSRYAPPEEHIGRSEEHTSELQSLAYLVCRLLLEKKKIHQLSDLHI